MLTIGQLAKRFSTSRSTLIYYDTIGLLKPSLRSESNYRLYSDADVLKMEKILSFRNIGLDLDNIKQLLNRHNDELHTALENRMLSINREIQELRNQQKVILALLKKESDFKHTRVMNKETWISLLKAAGLDNEGMTKWHIAFETSSPEAHQDFLESLGISAKEIQQIREHSKPSPL